MSTTTTNMARIECMHPVPAGLLTKLLSMHTIMCPLCLLRSNVLAVRDAQAALESHSKIEAASNTTSEDEKNKKGGEAEEKAQEERKRIRKEKMKAQKKEQGLLVKQLRHTKVKLHNAVDIIEQLQSERAEVQWNFHLDRAVNFWERWRDGCTMTSTYESSRGGSISANDSPSKSAIEKESGESGDPVNPGPWQLVKDTRHNARTRRSDNRVTKPSSPNRNASRRASSSNAFAVLNDHPEESDHAPSSPPTTPPPSGQTTPAPPAPSLRPCLKRARTPSDPDPDSEPHPPKKARIDETATVLAGGLSYTRTSSTRPHSSHPAPLRTLKRKSRRYRPSTWAPAHPHAFVDTSFVHVSAHVVESLQANIAREERGEVADLQECRTCPDLCVEPAVYCGECVALQWHRGREAEWLESERERMRCEREREMRVRREKRERKREEREEERVREREEREKARKEWLKRVR